SFFDLGFSWTSFCSSSGGTFQGPSYMQENFMQRLMICRTYRMSNEHARTGNVRNHRGLRAKDKGPETGFLARRLRTKPSIRGSVNFLTLRIRESCEVIQRLFINFASADKIRGQA